jgi:hypothetical protein
MTIYICLATVLALVFLSRNRYKLPFTKQTLKKDFATQIVLFEKRKFKLPQTDLVSEWKFEQNNQHYVKRICRLDTAYWLYSATVNKGKVINSVVHAISESNARGLMVEFSDCVC